MAVLLFGRCKQPQGLNFERRSTLLHFDVVGKDRRLTTNVSISSESVPCDDLSDDESESVRLRFPPVGPSLTTPTIYTIHAFLILYIEICV